MYKDKIEKLLGELTDELSDRVSEIKMLLEIWEEEKISPQKIELEEENFRVDSSGWGKFTSKQGIRYLNNPEKDIWEYAGGVKKELIGQQLFTYLAAMRETKKAGKRIPTDKEFNQFNKEDFGKIVYTGYRGTDNYFFNLSTVIFFWSSSVSGGAAWRRNLSSDRATVHRNASSKSNGFSVRCLRD